MLKPANWKGDPECGHEVACAHQTHYCIYIRVPRLLTLQHPQTPDDLLLIAAFQWYELWFKVLLVDLRAALADDGTTYEPVKLLRRGVELFNLFGAHADFAESVIVRGAGLTQPVRVSGALAASEQFNALAALTRRLSRFGRMTFPGLAEAARDYAAHFKTFRARFRKFLKDTLIPRRSKTATYAGWLCLPELLALQDGPKSAWHEPGAQPTALMATEDMSADENMFVIAHQAFEVWFKVMLDHIDHATQALLRGDVTSATTLCWRINRLQRWLTQQIQIPATMLPLDFLRFRSQKMERDGKLYQTGLSPASGTESYQFREIEIACGLRGDEVFQKYLEGHPTLPIRLLTPRQARRMEQPTLGEAFEQAVRARGIRRMDDLFTVASAPNPHADLARLADILIEFDEFFRFWRLWHMSMVEKMIGAKSGTGFLGPEYLMETAGVRVQAKNRVFDERQIRPRFFEELWAVRTRMGSY